MKSARVKIDEVKVNPLNPRTIKDHKFKQLVKSIQEFPEMIEYRPIVVDENMVILGGNMRYRASVEAGIKEIYILRAENLSEEKKKEFIIKDNANFGEWDWDMLANSFDDSKLNEWGLNVWSANDVDFGKYDDEEDNSSNESDDNSTGVPSNSESKIEGEKVIQIEFLITDYDEAFEVATLLRKKSVNIGEILIQTMKKQLQNGN